jgi:N-acetylglucosaminyldiphosphoundecaprenol N-acetyl-beta-D-mannosaminyltransferase
MRAKVLGLPVDILNRTETFEVIEKWLDNGTEHPKMIVTAYSEFFVNGVRDAEFAKIIKNADLVTPDGKSVLAANKYLKRAKGKSAWKKILLGLSVGSEILSGTVGESVTGVWLFDAITKNAEKKNWRIFLLGGLDNVGAKAAQMLLERFPHMKVDYDEGEIGVGTNPLTDKRVVEKINRFKPDFLFVQYRPIVQEKWIASHLANLKVGVAMGIGGTLDEYVGKLANPPKWMEERGLKWLWRLYLQPRRWRRMIDAVIVFPWMVFKST